MSSGVVKDVESGQHSTPDEKYDEVVLEEMPYSLHSKAYMRTMTSIVCFAGLMSPLTGSVLFPITTEMSRDLNKPTEQINLLVTYYMLSQGICPMLWASVGDTLGRRIVYLGTMAVFIGMSVGIAVENNYSAVAVLRCFQAFGSAPTIAIGAGTIADMYDPSERGLVMGLFQSLVMVGPSLAPLITAALDTRWGWHAIFYFLTVSGALVFLIVLFFLPETLRALVWNGSVRPPLKIHYSLANLIRKRFFKAREPYLFDEVPEGFAPPRKKAKDIRPFMAFEIVARNWQMACLLSVLAASNAVFYILQLATGNFFLNNYGLTTVQTGLCFLPMGLGNLVGSLASGRLMNYEFARQKRKILETVEGEEHDALERQFNSKKPDSLVEFPLEVARLIRLPLDMLLVVLPTIAFGWLIDKHVHMAAPLVMLFPAGYGTSCVNNAISTYCVDINPSSSSSASAASNLFRSLFAAACTGFAFPMIHGIGIGWTITFFALLLLITMPIILVQFHKGGEWRKARIMREREAKEAQEAKNAESEEADGDKGTVEATTAQPEDAAESTGAAEPKDANSEDAAKPEGA